MNNQSGAMVEKILFKKSPDSGSTENSPKYPEYLEYGEIAINYGAGHEGIIIQNDNNELLLFSPDEKIMNYISSKEFVVSEALNELNDKILTVSGEVETKQDTLVSGTNIKTINNQSLLGSGNIDIQGGGGESYTAGTNIDITNNVISVTGITVPTSNSAFTNDAGYVTSGNVKTQVEAYHYISSYTETDPTVPSWAKEQNKPSYTASEVGAMSSAATLDNVPDGTTRKLSNYALQADFSAHTGNTQVHLPVVTSEDEGKIMRVVNGVWTLVSPSTIYSGPYAPDSNIGNNGDLYLQTT